MASICPDFKWFGFQISDPIQYPGRSQTNLFLTIQNPDKFGFQMPTLVEISAQILKKSNALPVSLIENDVFDAVQFESHFDAKMHKSTGSCNHDVLLWKRRLEPLIRIHLITGYLSVWYSDGY